MKLRLFSLAALSAVAAVQAADDLPKHEPGELLDLEPTLMLAPDWEDSADERPVALPSAEAVARLEAELARAIRDAKSGERLFKSGVIAKVDAETRALKVLHLTAQLAAARLTVAAAERDIEAKRFEANEVSKESVEKAEAAWAAASAAAAESESKWQRAQLAAAELNLHRRQQLLRSGIGTKAQVRRAEDQLAAVKRKNSASEANVPP